MMIARAGRITRLNRELPGLFARSADACHARALAFVQSRMLV